MTEEIIIDGVNVAGCDYVLNNSLKGKHQCPNKTMPYAKETSCTSCKVNSTLHNFCKNNPNCYYKQLIRLEQERDELKENYKEDHAELLMARSKIESLKSNLEEFVHRADFAGKENDKLKQENKELKEENKQHIKEKQILHERLYCYAYEKDCHLVCKQQNCLLKNSYTYRSALEEIKAIINQPCDNCKYNKDGVTCSIGDCGEGKLKIIENKINEVLE